MSLPVYTFYHYYCNFHHCYITYKCMTTSLFYSNYDKLHLLYAGGSHVLTLECLYYCLLDNMFLFCRNKLILILPYLNYLCHENRVNVCLQNLMGISLYKLLYSLRAPMIPVKFSNINESRMPF